MYIFLIILIADRHGICNKKKRRKLPRNRNKRQNGFDHFLFRDHRNVGISAISYLIFNDGKVSFYFAEKYQQKLYNAIESKTCRPMLRRH